MIDDGREDLGGLGVDFVEIGLITRLATEIEFAFDAFADGLDDGRQVKRVE